MTKVFQLIRMLLLCATVQVALGQAPSQAAEEEAIKRQEKAILLRKTLDSARSAQGQKDLKGAAKLYEDAYAITEVLGTAVETERKQTITGLSDVRLQLAIAAQREGDVREANVQASRALKVNTRPSRARLASG